MSAGNYDQTFSFDSIKRNAVITCVLIAHNYSCSISKVVILQLILVLNNMPRPIFINDTYTRYIVTWLVTSLYSWRIIVTWLVYLRSSWDLATRENTIIYSPHRRNTNVAVTSEFSFQSTRRHGDTATRRHWSEHERDGLTTISCRSVAIKFSDCRWKDTSKCTLVNVARAFALKRRVCWVLWCVRLLRSAAVADAGCWRCVLERSDGDIASCSSPSVEA